MNETKAILTEIIDRLADLSASVDALELELAESGQLRRDAIKHRFQTHKQIVETHLAQVRQSIAFLPE